MLVRATRIHVSSAVFNRKSNCWALVKRPTSILGMGVAVAVPGAGGIGSATAERYLQEGACVMLADINDDALASTLDNLSGRFGADAKTMSKIAEFLGVTNEFSNPSTIAKVINRPYSEILANHGDVVAAIKKSEFSALAKSV